MSQQSFGNDDDLIILDPPSHVRLYNVHIMSFILFTQQFQPGGDSKKPTQLVPVQCLMVVIDPENIPIINTAPYVWHLCLFLSRGPKLLRKQRAR